MALKPGWRTTEFWATVIAAAGGWIAYIANALPPRYAAILNAAVVGLYAVGRGLAKRPTTVVSPPPVTVAGSSQSVPANTAR